MAFPGMSSPGLSGDATLDEQKLKEQQMIKYMQSAMESCVAKTAMSGVMGFGLGGVFGLFMSSMRYDAPMMTPGADAITKLPVKDQLRQGFKEMGKASWSSAKNFGLVGSIFAGTECCIEGVCFLASSAFPYISNHGPWSNADIKAQQFRAKNDLYNGVAAGCITGGALAAKAGPQAAALGCAGFAGFSAAIDYYMRMPSDDTSADPIA
ncbi:hypothetical protein AUEXF2481DRAFT_30570 [Aureobasidium subglaciale EXF-2481]|uniref:Mitochondrial import inner membrane translocase subunit TIM22 n=1 Tax=Aureobasidium subglaciale (strain EXF-2481) TaxID=1043005 RepID=A0A074YIV3_AURSE|nr:uncharacterized protein AUEXF2481DRAFT_30570 [Aureobasidium subglaciale EXF-2481]KEQ94017.1 hypothetical protein AUEXF2481DRAFT_30570 [Aureobasidium subglaciale EXF-2481]